VYVKRQIPLRLPEEVFDQVKKRAEERQISVNEWLTRAITASLLSKTDKIVVNVRTEYRL
jgi:predicted HicB family RNase H-like nuclease